MGRYEGSSLILTSPRGAPPTLVLAGLVLAARVSQTYVQSVQILDFLAAPGIQCSHDGRADGVRLITGVRRTGGLKGAARNGVPAWTYSFFLLAPRRAPGTGR